MHKYNLNVCIFTCNCKAATA